MAFALVGVLVLVMGLLSGLLAGAVIADDMTPDALGRRYLYGTSGHPELMTAHEWAMLTWFGGSLLVAGLGGAMGLGGIVGALRR